MLVKGGDSKFNWGGTSARVKTGGAATTLHCQGALTILCADEQSTGVLPASEVIHEAEWHGIDATLPFPRYASPERYTSAHIFCSKLGGVLRVIQYSY